MSIALTDAVREEAIQSIQRYAEENFDEPMGNIAAGSLLEFVLEEIAPSVYNRAVADTCERIQARLMDIDVELHKPEFTFWSNRH